MEKENPYSFEAVLLVDTVNIDNILSALVEVNRKIRLGRTNEAIPLTVRGIAQSEQLNGKTLYDVAIDRMAWDAQQYGQTSPLLRIGTKEELSKLGIMVNPEQTSPIEEQKEEK